MQDSCVGAIMDTIEGRQWIHLVSLNICGVFTSPFVAGRACMCTAYDGWYAIGRAIILQHDIMTSAPNKYFLMNAGRGYSQRGRRRYD